MKKGALIAFLLVMAVVFCAPQMVMADTIRIDLTGAYLANDYLRWQTRDGLPPQGDTPGAIICEWHRVDRDWTGADGVEITAGLVGDGVIGDNSRAWSLFNEDDGDFTNYEFSSEAYKLQVGTLTYFNASFLNGNASFMRYYLEEPTTAPGIVPNTYYGIVITAIDDLGNGFDIGDFNPANLEVHASPIPSALLLLGSGFVGLVGFRRFRRK
jgi:hypothetical protein